MTRFIQLYYGDAWHVVNVSWIEDVRLSDGGHASLKLRHEEFYHPIGEDQYYQIVSVLDPKGIDGRFEVNND